MNRTWQMVVPYIWPKWNLEQFLESLGDEVEIPTLIIDNSPESDTKSMKIDPRIEVELHPENLGVAASWNKGLERGAEQTIVCSASMRFKYGFRHVLKLADREVTQWGCQWPGDDIAWHFRAVGRAMANVNGTFDENFYPIYMEDCDYGMRYTALGWCPEQGVVSAHASGLYAVGCAVAVKHRLIDSDPNGHKVLAYYIEKWGGRPGEEKFKHPFNDPTKHVSWWERR